MFDDRVTSNLEVHIITLGILCNVGIFNNGYYLLGTLVSISHLCRLNIFIVSNLRNIFLVKMASNINIELTSVVLTS